MSLTSGSLLNIKYKDNKFLREYNSLLNSKNFWFILLKVASMNFKESKNINKSVYFHRMYNFFINIY